MALTGEAFTPWPFLVGQIEFEFFRKHAAGSVRQAVESNARFAALRDAFSFYVDDVDADRVQIFFGKRSMFRKTKGGRTAVEGGLTLLYTLGPEGTAAVILYPATSDFHEALEDHIFLAIRRMTGHQLLTRLRKDIFDLVAYGHVTSLDGVPTTLEKLRIWWLREAQPKQVEGQFSPAELPQLLAKLGGTAVSSLLSAVFRPLAIIGIIALLLYLGWPQVAEWLKK